MDNILSILKGSAASLLAYATAILYPIHDFYLVIAIMATINIIIGWKADSMKWSFKKAFSAIWYLIGYMALLAISLIVGRLMHLDENEVVKFTSWVTWVMIYFYSANILRNWNIWQPENRTIAFLYWVVTFKIVDKIKYLKEFNEKEKNDT